MEALRLLRAYGIRPKCILHIGAHWGQEAPAYRAAGARFALFVEAIPEVFQQLSRNIGGFPGFRAVCALCSAKNGKIVKFHVSSNDAGSSSMLEFGSHADIYPDIRYTDTLLLKTITADELVKRIAPGQPFDLVVLDTQGSELSVLRGSHHILRAAKALWIEVSEETLYKGGCSFDEVTAYVRRFGFRLRHVRILREGWGDALYVRVAREQTFAGSRLVGRLTKTVLPIFVQSLLSRVARGREVEELRQSRLFDPDWYLEKYPDVADARLDPIQHYVEHGWQERRDPGPHFSTKQWLKENPGYGAASSPLLRHLRASEFFGGGTIRSIKDLS